MTMRVLGTEAEARDYMPLLKWLILTGVIIVGLIALWHFGLIQFMLSSDRSRLSIVILAIYGLTTVHCLIQTYMVSRDLVSARRVRHQIEAGVRGYRLAGERVQTDDGQFLPAGTMTDHIRDLVAKAQLQGAGKRLDQTLLLRGLADRLRGRQKLGWFVAEALLRLALLGTAIGFIIMLIPISGIQAFDAGTMSTALGDMSSGMAIALNVTVAGLVTALLLKMQYYFLDSALAALFATVTETTEVYVVSALEHGVTDGGK